MAIIGTIMVYIMMACLLAGCAAHLVKPESELGNKFVEGVSAIGPVFLQVGGIFAALPVISSFISKYLGSFFQSIGMDPSMAPNLILSADSGAYQIADLVALNRESWILSIFVGLSIGCTIMFNMPVGMATIDKKDNKYFALGILSGLLAVPFAVLYAGIGMMLLNPSVRSAVSTTAASDYAVKMTWSILLHNILPLAGLCLLLAVGMIKAPKAMIKGFTILGKIIDCSAKIVFVLCIVEYYTGLGTAIFGSWPFDSLMADENELMHCLELCGAVGMMLAGAYPFVYLVNKVLGSSMEKLGKVFHLSRDAMVGIFAAMANALALFPLIKDMKPADKVRTLAFLVCGSFILSDYLSFFANFQPNLIVIMLVSKILGGITALLIAHFIGVPKAKALEAAE